MRAREIAIPAVMLLSLSVSADTRLPSPKQIVSFCADPIPREPSDHFRDFRVTERDLKQILTKWHVVPKDDWHHKYHHVAFGCRTGTVNLASGKVLKWMVKPGGLATITFPDKTTLFLAKSKPWP